jgi:hypothetical protein
MEKVCKQGVIKIDSDAAEQTDEVNAQVSRHLNAETTPSDTAEPRGQVALRKKSVNWGASA